MIRRLFRWAFYLFLVLVILFVAGLLLMDTAARAMIENRIRSETGLEVKIDRCRVGFSRSTVTLENLKLYNPAEFGGGPWLEAPELHLELDRHALQSGKLHFRLVRLHITRLHVVERKDGETNLRHFQKTQGTDTTPALSAATRRSARKPQFESIDMLNLTWGRAKFTSLRDPTRSREAVLDVNQQIYTNVTEKDLEAIFIALALKKRAEFLVEGFLLNPMESGDPVPAHQTRAVLEGATTPLKKVPLKK